MPISQVEPPDFSLEPVLHPEHGDVVPRVCAATEADIAAWDRTWRPGLVGQPDGEWDWAGELALSKELEGHLCVAVTHIGHGATHLDALLSLRSSDEIGSRLERGQQLVFVDYIGVAPDHQQPPIGSRKLKGLGGVLVDVASAVSDALGYGGRVGLHATKPAEPFYKRLGMTPVGYEVVPEGKLLYYEGDPKWARDRRR